MERKQWWRWYTPVDGVDGDVNWTGDSEVAARQNHEPMIDGTVKAHETNTRRWLAAVVQLPRYAVHRNARRVVNWSVRRETRMIAAVQLHAVHPLIKHYITRMLCRDTAFSLLNAYLYPSVPMSASVNLTYQQADIDVSHSPASRDWSI